MLHFTSFFFLPLYTHPLDIDTPTPLPQPTTTTTTHISFHSLPYFLLLLLLRLHHEDHDPEPSRSKLYTQHAYKPSTPCLKSGLQRTWPTQKALLPLPQDPTHCFPCNLVGIPQVEVSVIHGRICRQFCKEMVGLGLVLDSLEETHFCRGSGDVRGRIQDAWFSYQR